MQHLALAYFFHVCCIHIQLLYYRCQFLPVSLAFHLVFSEIYCQCSFWNISQLFQNPLYYVKLALYLSSCSSCTGSITPSLFHVVKWGASVQMLYCNLFIVWHRFPPAATSASCMKAVWSVLNHYDVESQQQPHSISQPAPCEKDFSSPTQDSTGSICSLCCLFATALAHCVAQDRKCTYHKDIQHWRWLC